MPDPITIPSPFGEGSPLSARLLNGLQEEILRQLYEHTHAGGNEGPQLEKEGYADRSVTEPKLADGAISSRTIGDAAVDQGHIANGAVTQNTIADGAVGTNQIADDSVTEGKLGPNVRLKLNRIGGGVSSASSVIWRDPLVVFPPQGNSPTLIETFYQPREVYWNPAMIGRTDDDEPVRLNPRVTTVGGQEVLDSFDVFKGDLLQQQEPALAKIVEDSVQIATQEINVVGAFALRNTQSTVQLLADSGALDLARGTVSSGASIAEAASAPPPAPDGVEIRAFAMRTAATESAPAPRATTTTASGNRTTEAIARQAASNAAAAAAAASLSLTQNGTQAAVRMTTVGVVDAKGVPVQPGTEGAYTVTSGFSGKNDFLNDGPALDYRSIGNDADRQRAAKGASQTLYNLGLDTQYLDNSGHKLDPDDLEAFQGLQAGDDSFFAGSSSFLGGQSWLLDLLNNPQLLGSGYAISGGRNILSVVRSNQILQASVDTGNDDTNGETSDRDGAQDEEWVRVRFITPYKDSSYAVSVTPRDVGTAVVVAQIKEKTPSYCDLTFYGISPLSGIFRSNKVSFDLAVFGDLTTAE